MLKILNTSPSLINHFLYEMRHKDIQKDRAKFRNNLKRLGMVMGYEISKTFEYQTSSVETPLEETNVDLVKNNPLLVGVLRAASPFLDGFVEVMDLADIGFIGAYRREEGDNIEAALDYIASDSVEGRELIIVDPMLATGKSLLSAVNSLLKTGMPSKLHIASVVAAPEGVKYITDNLTIDHTIWTASLDKALNSNAYILPGLGDAGDLCFGPKL